MDGRLGAYEGTHKGCPYGGFDGTGGTGLAKPLRLGTCWIVGTRSMREVVGEGALRGRSPRTREGRIGPTARRQGLGARGQGLVNGERRLSAKRREETRKAAAGRQSPSRAFADRGVEVEEICNET